MTFQRKRTLKRAARILFDYCFVIGCYMIAYFFAVPPHQLEVLYAVLILIFVWAFIVDRFDKRSIAFIPDEIDKTCTSEQVNDFSNRFDWMVFFYCEVWIAFVLLTANWGFHMQLFYRPKSSFIMAAVSTVCVLIGILYYSRNKYIIEGEILHIKEYTFFRPMTEICIPLSDINDIRIKAPYSPVRSRLVLTIGGIDRELRCTTNIIPLAQRLFWHHPMRES